MRHVQGGWWENSAEVEALGLNESMLREAVQYTYRVLDSLDATLLRAGEPRLAGLLELANLSAVIGNLFRGGLARASSGRFQANGPHKYPDLLCIDPLYAPIEIKVALEKYNPKGHLVKPGPHVTIRYVLGDEKGTVRLGKKNRGDVAWIWEVRAGYLTNRHFNVSNTAGDSGKTAVVNKAGMAALRIAFVDKVRSPFKATSRTYKALPPLGTLL